MSLYRVNDFVTLSDGREAIVRYVGGVEFAPGVWIGLALVNPTGKHQGTVNGITYFECDPKHGTFVRAHRIIAKKSPRQPTRPKLSTSVNDIFKERLTLPRRAAPPRKKKTKRTGVIPRKSGPRDASGPSNWKPPEWSKSQVPKLTKSESDGVIAQRRKKGKRGKREKGGGRGKGGSRRVVQRKAGPRDVGRNAKFESPDYGIDLKRDCSGDFLGDRTSSHAAKMGYVPAKEQFMNLRDFDEETSICSDDTNDTDSVMTEPIISPLDVMPPTIDVIFEEIESSRTSTGVSVSTDELLSPSTTAEPAFLIFEDGPPVTPTDLPPRSPIRFAVSPNMRKSSMPSHRHHQFDEDEDEDVEHLSGFPAVFDPAMIEAGRSRSGGLLVRGQSGGKTRLSVTVESFTEDDDENSFYKNPWGNQNRPSFSLSSVMDNVNDSSGERVRMASLTEDPNENEQSVPTSPVRFV